METILRYDSVDECWYAWSVVPKHINAMKKRGWTLLSEQDGCVSMKAPAYAVHIGKAEKSIQKSISEEQKEAMRKRLADAREIKKIQR